MEPPKPTLSVIYSRTALRELDKIWEYNVRAYGSTDHANQYVDFLRANIRALSTGYEDCRKVETNDRLRFILIKRSSQGNEDSRVHLACLSLLPRLGEQS